MPEEEANDIALVVYGLDPIAHWDMRAEMAWPVEVHTAPKKARILANFGS